MSDEGSDVSATVLMCRLLAAEQGVQGALHRYPRQGRRLELEHFGGLSDFLWSWESRFHPHISTQRKVSKRERRGRIDSKSVEKKTLARNKRMKENYFST